jgi:hypothetical protein
LDRALNAQIADGAMEFRFIVERLNRAQSVIVACPLAELRRRDDRLKLANRRQVATTPLRAGIDSSTGRVALTFHAVILQSLPGKLAATRKVDSSAQQPLAASDGDAT